MSAQFQIPLGPVVVFGADDVSDPFDQWVHVGGSIGGLTLTPAINRAVGGNDLLGITPEKGRTYDLGPVSSATWAMAREDLDILSATFPEMIAGTTGAAIGLRGPNQTVSEKALALVPVEEYDALADDLPWWNAKHVTYLPSALLQIDAFRMFKVPGSGETVPGHRVSAVGLSGSPTAYVGDLREFGLNPIGIRFDWQQGIDEAIETALLGAGEITGLQTFPSEGITMMLRLNVSDSEGEVSLGDSALESGTFSIGISDSGAWVKANGTNYAQADTGGVSETIIQLLEDGTVTVWDDGVKTIDAAATESLSGLTLKSSGDDVSNSYTESETDAVVIVIGALTPAQIRKALRT